MTTTALVTGSEARPSAARSLARIVWLESRAELLKAWRMPAFSVPTITFPVFFYALFGLGFGGRPVGGVTMATYLVATYGAFAVMGSALFAFGVGIAIERGQGWLLLKRATPMPPFAYFAAKMATAMVFGLISVLMLCVLGAAAGGVRLEASAWLSLLATLVLGALPFSAFGLLIGSLAGPNSAVPITNLVYLPAAFASGMWIPIQALPRLFKALAPSLPSYHFAQLALGRIGASQGGDPLGHVAYLVGFTLVCLVLARIAWARTDDRTFG
jgi:ABC-2 type transport system permease protein